MINKFDEIYMEEAIQLAEKGAGRVNPNPLVGHLQVKKWAKPKAVLYG